MQPGQTALQDAGRSDVMAPARMLYPAELYQVVCSFSEFMTPGGRDVRFFSTTRASN